MVGRGKRSSKSSGWQGFCVGAWCLVGDVGPSTCFKDFDHISCYFVVVSGIASICLGLLLGR